GHQHAPEHRAVKLWGESTPDLPPNERPWTVTCFTAAHVPCTSGARVGFRAEYASTPLKSGAGEGDVQEAARHSTLPGSNVRAAQKGGHQHGHRVQALRAAPAGARADSSEQGQATGTAEMPAHPEGRQHPAHVAYG